MVTIFLVALTITVFVFAFLEYLAKGSERDFKANQLAKETVDMENIKFIDLGLPSGTLWANKNLGAAENGDNGVYYSQNEALKLEGVRLPSYEQFNELKANTTQEFIRLENGRCGIFFRSKKNDNHIFLPSAGKFYHPISSGGIINYDKISKLNTFGVEGYYILNEKSETFPYKGTIATFGMDYIKTERDIPDTVYTPIRCVSFSK